MGNLLNNRQACICMTAFVFAVSVCSAGSVGHAQNVQQMQQERAEFVKEIRRVENLNNKYTDEIEQLRGQIKDQQSDFEERMASLERKVKESHRLTKPEKKDKKSAEGSGVSPELEAATFDILSKGAEMDPEDEAFRKELARAHYNMGNIFYERGEYQRSVVEYYQSLDLIPYDPDTHYNLAFISGEFLGDQETSLKHYQWYLYLKPDADDKQFVTKKMVQAKLHLRSLIDSPLEEKGVSQYNVGR